MNENSPKFSIQDMLAEKSVSGLTSIAKSLGLKGYSGKKKAAIINLIVPKVTSKEFLEDLLLVVDRRAWSAILSARSAPTHVPDSASGPCKSLARLGILRWTEKEDGVWLGMPKEIKDVFVQFEKDGFLERKRKADLLDEYAMATTHLYGLIRQEDFVALFNKQNDVSTDIDEMFSILIQHVDIDAPYGFWKEYLTHFCFEENEYKDAEDLLQSIEGKPCFSPAKELLLKYERTNFFEENIFSDRIKLFLRKRLRCPEEMVSEIMSDFAFACMVDAPLAKIIGLLEPYNLPVTKDMVRELIPLVVNFSNSSRKWANRGFSPEDMRRQEDRQLPIRKGKKIGRNEPCPCGSGKKYKKCCGQ